MLKERLWLLVCPWPYRMASSLWTTLMTHQKTPGMGIVSTPNNFSTIYSCNMIQSCTVSMALPLARYSDQLLLAGIVQAGAFSISCSEYWKRWTCSTREQTHRCY
jgi:hypothetical protein